MSNLGIKLASGPQEAAAFDIDSLRTFADQDSTEKLVLKGNGQLAFDGRIFSRLFRLSSTHKETGLAFYRGLQAKYGKDIADALKDNNELKFGEVIETGKPLSSRRIKAVLEKAESLNQEKIGKANMKFFCENPKYINELSKISQELNSQYTIKIPPMQLNDIAYSICKNEKNEKLTIESLNAKVIAAVEDSPLFSSYAVVQGFAESEDFNKAFEAICLDKKVPDEAKDALRGKLCTALRKDSENLKSSFKETSANIADWFRSLSDLLPEVGRTVKDAVEEANRKLRMKINSEARDKIVQNLLSRCAFPNDQRSKSILKAAVEKIIDTETSGKDVFLTQEDVLQKLTEQNEVLQHALERIRTELGSAKN